MFVDTSPSRTMITFKDPAGHKFNCRVVGVIIDGDRVLLHRCENDDFWTFPGGRAELGESSEQSLLREMREELSSEVRVRRLLWLVEYFFEYEQAPCHEIAFYYLVNLPAGDQRLRMDSFTARDGGVNLLFKWFPLDAVPSIELYPVFLREALLSLPRSVAHVVCVERGEEQMTQVVEHDPMKE